MVVNYIFYMQIPIWGLDLYGLKEKDLKSLSTKIEVKVFLEWPSVKKMVPLTVPERKKFTEKFLKDSLQKTMANFALEDVFVRDENHREPDIFKAVITGPNLHRLINSGAAIRVVQIDKIRGRKQITITKLPKRESDWHLVTGLFVYQTKGKINGTQPQEGRAYLVFAKSLKEAEQKATREFKKMEHMYLGGKYDIMRNKFVKIIDSKVVVSEKGQFDTNELYFISSHDLPPVKITPATAWK